MKPLNIEPVKRSHASLYIPTNDVNHKIVDEMKRRFKREIEAVDNWIALPDRKSLSKIQPLIDYIRDTYDPINQPIYRGFNVGGFQEDLGLRKNGLFKRGGTEVGDVVEATIVNPVSFTTDLKISSGFGKYIVELTGYSQSNLFVITNELSYIISERRNLFDGSGLMETQAEVILLPSDDPVELTLLSNTGAKGLSRSGYTLEHNRKWLNW